MSTTEMAAMLDRLRKMDPAEGWEAARHAYAEEVPRA